MGEARYTCQTCHLHQARYWASARNEQWMVCASCRDQGIRLGVDHINYSTLDIENVPERPPKPPTAPEAHSLLDAAESRYQQRLGEERVEAATPHEWRDRARASMRHVASTTPTFTTDQVWDHLARTYFDYQPPEPRAMSGIVRWAINQHIIEFTGQMVATARPEAHSNPKRQYRSLLLSAP